MTTWDLGAADRGSRHEVATGDTVMVCLPETASTGFIWSVVALPGGVALLDEHLDMSPGALPGAAGEHRFRFLVHGEVEGELALELRRAWERLDKPEDRYSLDLVAASRREADAPTG